MQGKGATCDISKLLAGLQQGQEIAIEAGRKAIDLFGEHTLGNAQEITPVETGALQASATAQRATMEGTRVTKLIGFNTNYAAARHERPPELDAPPRQNPRGRWKFLESAIREAVPKLAPFVAGRIKDALGA